MGMTLRHSAMLSDDQEAEIAKYEKCYGDPRYGMGLPRRKFTDDTLRALPVRGSLLDVGAGRGETMDMAWHLGFRPVYGTEVVSGLIGQKVLKALAWDLPFEAQSFDVVTCLDVMEHLLPDDADRTIREINRVTRKVAFFSIANHESWWNGYDLHVNKLPFPRWHDKLSAVFPAVERLENKHSVNNANWLCWS